MKRIVRQYGSPAQPRLQLPANLLRHFSVTSVYIVVTLLLVAASLVAYGLNSQASKAHEARSDTSTTTQETELVPLESSSPESGETKPMQDQNADTPNLKQSEPVTNDSSTTVTVNGDSVTVPAGETFEDSYVTESENGTTRVHISVDSNSSSYADSDSNTNIRERSRLHIRSESSTSTQH